ncbi:MAG: hypothetical protein Q8941_16570 [Bacteroidota bacterium]|nr:hypothetical protein [Bacteroidota bacterium]
MKLRKFKKILLWFFLSLLFLIIALWVFIQTPFGQNWITQQVTSRLSKDLHTKIKITHVDFSLFNKMKLQGVLVEDRQQDTLLYAGEVQVHITDWFFFTKNVELKYIGLENAVINLQRTDSIWNHQFLVDYFSSPSSGNKKEGGTQLSLKKTELRNVTFRQKDGWRGEDMIITLGALDLDAKDINFSKKNILVNSITIDKPVLNIYKYQGKRPELPEGDNKPAADSLLQWNADGWVVQVNKLEIKNGDFIANKESQEPLLASFDGQHIDFNKIQGVFTNLRWEKDTITSHIDLRAKERSGFEVKNLVANVKMTPREMAFADLNIRTNNSTIKNFFRMSFNDFDDMGDFIRLVKMQGDFDGSEIDSDDIAYFAPFMTTWKKKITLKGNVKGTVDDMIGRGMLIQAGKNTLLNGDISLTGLPDINQTFIDFKANDFRTTYEDAVAIVPDIRTVTAPDLRKLQFIRFNGSFTGFIRDFVTFGTIQTNLGTVKSDLNMKLPAHQDPLYSGTISTDFFRLGEFINDPEIGSIAMNGSLQGKGFNENNRNAVVDGKIRFVDFNDYRYTNITVKGKLDKKLFDGAASIVDPEAELALNGLIDFNSEVPVFNFTADVKKANLKNLKLTDDDIAFNGKFNLNFTGDNIDNFLGNARITEASLTHNGNPLPFDSLVVSSEYVNNIKKLSARSNEFEGSISGNFNIRDLPDAFNLFLNKYYPAYIRPAKKIPENESFGFDFTTQYVDDYVKLVDSALSGFNNSHIYGSLNTANNELVLNAEVPQFKFKTYSFDDVKLSAKGNRDSLSLSGGAANISISDSVNIPLASFHIRARNDSSRVLITTSTNQAINQASLNAQVLTYNNGVKIEFNRSSFVISGKRWTIDENGELEFLSNVPASGQLVLRESNQEIKIKSRPSEIGDWNNLAVELKKVNVGDFSPLLLPNNRLEGLVSGNVLIEDPTRNLHITSNNILAEGVRLDNDSLGNVRVTADYDGKNKELKAKGNTENQDNSLGFNADIFFDKSKEANNVIALKAKNFQLKVLERFLGDLFSDMQGYVTGDFDILGDFDQLQVVGKGRLKDAGLKVNFTQCFYKIQDTDVELTSNEIKLDGIVLTDPVTGNPIYIRGGIQHSAFKNMFFDVTVSTQKPNTSDSKNNKPVLLLNTGYNDNKQFYGRVKGTGSFSLSGSQSEMFMQIAAVASTTDTSSIVIPSFQSRESGMADFLVERKYGHEMVDSGFSKNATNIIYDVDVTANPKLTVRVVLDEMTGDEIKGKGTGTLNIHSGTTEPLTIRGKFDIEEGEYIYTFQPLLPKKPFKISKGGDNNISWSGDPYSAKINFEAVYTAEGVSFAPLVNSLNLNESLSRQREDVYVKILLTGDLFKPRFSFKLDFAPNSIFKNDFVVAANIQQMEKNENEINRQVAYLIGFNSFAPLENTTGNIAGTGSSPINELFNTTFSSLSGLIFNEINRKLNTELAKILKTDKVGINFSGSVYNRNLLNNQTSNTNFGFNQSNFNVTVPISLFKDRFIVTLGSTLDVPLQTTIQQTVQFLPDVTAEWLINESGTIRASFFYRQNLDYLTGSSTGAARTKRSGASIAYRKEFDTLGELFKGSKGSNKNKRKQQPPLQPPPADTLQRTTTILPPRK